MHVNMRVNMCGNMLVCTRKTTYMKVDLKITCLPDLKLRCTLGVNKHGNINVDIHVRDKCMGICLSFSGLHI